MSEQTTQTLYLAGDPVKVLAADGQILNECARIIKPLGPGPDGQIYYKLDTGSPGGWPESGLAFVDNLALALRLAGRGWYVFPCHETDWSFTKKGKVIPRKAKEPYWHKSDLPHGKDNATLDPALIRKWWGRWPAALVGLYCEKSGLFALDIDAKGDHDGYTTLAALIDTLNGGDWPEVGPAQNTPSGGAHLLFAWPAGLAIPNNAGKLGDGLDLRSNGYICSGGLYQWQPEHGPDTELTQAPAWLLELIRKLKPEKANSPTTSPQVNQSVHNSGDSADHWLAKALARARLGNRNDTGLWLACLLRDEGLSKGEAEAVMRSYASKVPQYQDDLYTDGEALASLKEAYKRDPRPPARSMTGDSLAHFGGNGHKPSSPQSGGDPEGQGEGKPKSENQRKNPLGYEYVQFLAGCNYTFSLCALDDSLWVNGTERMSDPLEAEIRTKLRDAGFGRVNVAADAYLAHARKNTFHPVNDYLNGLQWDRADHIAQLATWLTDRHGNTGLILRKWLIGAVARTMTGGKQNRVMVFEGKQGCGKSYLARWLASPLEAYFSEAMPNPDDKDSRLALATTWLWELKELGAITRRSDRESLKAWLTLESITERPAYGRHAIHKPAITSFIATVNNEGGFFNDPTGSRRYMTLAIEAIDWGYTKAVNINQVWAQAVALFKTGEDWNLTPDEQALVEAVNDEYEFTPAVYDWLDKFIDPSPDGAFLPASEVIKAVKDAGIGGTDNSISREVAGWMKKHGFEDGRSYVEFKVVGQGAMTRRVRGYFGAKILIQDFAAII